MITVLFEAAIQADPKHTQVRHGHCPLWGSRTGRSQTHTGETWSLSSLRQRYRQIPNTHRWDMVTVLFEAAVQADPKHTQVRHDHCPLWGSGTGRSQTHTGETWSLSSLRQRYRQIPNTHRWDMITVLFEAAVQADPKHTQVRHDHCPLWGSGTGRSQTHTGETWSLSSLRQPYRQIPNTHRWDMITVLFEAAVQADPKHTQVRHGHCPLWGSRTGRSQTHTGETWSLSSLRQPYRQIPNTHRWDMITVLFEAAVQADPKHTQVRHDHCPLWGSRTGRSQTHTGETWSLSSLRQPYRQIPNTHRWDMITVLFEAVVQADPKHTQVRHDHCPLWGSGTGRSQTHTGETWSLSSLRQPYRQIPNTHRWDMVTVLFEAAVQADPKHTQVRHDHCPLWGSRTCRSQTHTGETWSLSSLRQPYRQIPNTHRWDMITVLFEAAVQADPKHTQVRHDHCPLWGSRTGRSQTHTGETWSLSSLRQPYRQIPNTHRWDMITVLFEAAVQADPKHTQVRHDHCPLWGSRTGRSQTHTGETWSLSSLRQPYRQIPNTHRWDMITVLFEAAVQADPKHTQVRHDHCPLWGSRTGRSQTHTGETWSLSSLRQPYRQIPNTHRWDMVTVLFEAAVQADPKHTQVRHDHCPLWGSRTGRSQTHTGETWSLTSLRQRYRQIPNTHRWDMITVLFEAAWLHCYWM